MESMSFFFDRESHMFKTKGLLLLTMHDVKLNHSELVTNIKSSEMIS